MASISRSHNFTANTVQDDDQFNTELDAIVAFLNTELSHLDGTNAFTAYPLLPDEDPTQGTQAARKLYADNKVYKARVTTEEPSTFTSTTSTSYVDWPPTAVGGPMTMQFTKQHDSTKLLVHAFGSGYTGVANTDMSFAVNIGGTDYNLGTFRHTQTSDHQTYGGMREFTGMAAGVKTITFRVKKDSQTSITCDQNDFFSMFVEERE